MGSSLQRGRATAVSSGAAAEGIVVWVCVGSKVLAQAGAAGARGSGVSLLGGRSGARTQDHLGVCTAAQTAGERLVPGRWLSPFRRRERGVWARGPAPLHRERVHTPWQYGSRRIG